MRHLCLLLLMSVIALPAVAADQTPPPKDKVIVYYLHRTARCPSCEKIEKLSGETIKEKFAAELKSGAMEWQSLNLDEPGNAHFENDYKLQWQSVVLSEIKDGKETRWKNLDKVWDLLDDDGAFKKYIEDEVRGFRLQETSGDKR
jgi:hypothetical protein